MRAWIPSEEWWLVAKGYAFIGSLGMEAMCHYSTPKVASSQPQPSSLWPIDALCWMTQRKKAGIHHTRSSYFEVDVSERLFQFYMSSFTACFWNIKSLIRFSRYNYIADILRHWIGHKVSVLVAITGPFVMLHLRRDNKRQWNPMRRGPYDIALDLGLLPWLG